VVARMINRLRLITGRDFGYDPAKSRTDNEGSIAAWEDWFAEDGHIRFAPHTPMIAIPDAPARKAAAEWPW